jgi:hypothetical protein
VAGLEREALAVRILGAVAGRRIVGAQRAVEKLEPRAIGGR